MNVFASGRRLPRTQLGRRPVLKGISLGAGGILLAPLLQKIAAAAEGKATPPKRVIFLLFDNGFHERGAVPEGIPLQSADRRQLPLGTGKLPFDLEPFEPFRDRMTILHGLHTLTNVGHGGGFNSLAGIPCNDAAKYVSPQAISIDAAIAKTNPGLFPLLGLGVGNDAPNISYCSSAWGTGRPIAMHCRPELAYESLFGSVGATRNDFATQKNLLDHVTDDVRQFRGATAGPERELVDAHLEAIETLARRSGRLSEKFQNGTLSRTAPTLPKRPELVSEIMAAQCDIATAALVAGLTNVVTISSGLCSIMLGYTGISNGGGHDLGHGGPDTNHPNEIGRQRFGPLVLYRNFLAQQAARVLTALQQTKEGAGTMLDNTLLVFTSDSGNHQHSGTDCNWPFVLVGNLGGALRTGQFVSYPVNGDPADRAEFSMAKVDFANPLTNALYATLLHACGQPCDAFNRFATSSVPPTAFAPLPELLKS